jgi:hypothetical protein
MRPLAMFRRLPPPAPPRGRCCRPRLEPLEARDVPSTLPVTSGRDDAARGTLRYAVAHARDGDTILLTGAAAGGVVLTAGSLVLAEDVTVRAAGGRRVEVRAVGSRAFEVAAGAAVTLAGLAMTGGAAVAPPTSGAGRSSTAARWSSPTAP